MSQGKLPTGEPVREMPMFGFDKNEKAKSVPLKLLEQSIRVEDNLGRAYKTRPVQAWSLLTLMVGMLKDAEIAYKVNPIIVRADSSGVALNDIDRGENKWNKSLCPINKWIFDQLITKIDIPHVGGDLSNGTIMVAYTNRGISVALGLNVQACDNLCILGGQQMRTYKFEGNSGYDWETMKIHLRDWISNIDQKLNVETQIMERMMAREIENEDAIDLVLGKLYKKAVNWRYFNGPHAPFDLSGMSTFTQHALEQMGKVRTRKGDGHDSLEAYGNEINNVWDLYNWGTNVMKPQYERIEHLTESNRLYADFLCQEFGIEREDLVENAVVVE